MGTLKYGPWKSRAATRAGLVFAVVWVLVLAAAFVIYPRTDNMITGFLVHAWLGVDALGALSVGGVVVVAILQLVACFGLGYVVGILFSRFRGE